MSLRIEEIKEGSNLSALRREITQAHIDLYAAAGGDYNPVHIDPEFAKQTPLGGTVAHGMLIMAYVSEFMTDNFGEYWLTGGEIDCRFKAPARPGDLLTINGEISAMEKTGGNTTVLCDVLCRNQNNEPVLICDTKVRIRK